MTEFRIHSVVLLLAGITMAGTAPETPAPIDKIVYAQPFTLENGLAYPRREGKPQVNAGYLLIIDADPKLVLQRAMPSPILYVGKEIGWRLNPGYPSGRAFVLVSAELDKSGKVDLDLTRTRIWFGAPVPGLEGVLDSSGSNASTSWPLRPESEDVPRKRSRRPWTEPMANRGRSRTLASSGGTTPGS